MAPSQPSIPKPTSARFSTDDVPVRDRMAILHDVLGRMHLRVDIEPLGDAPFRAAIQTQTWASVSLFVADTDALSTTRTPELLSDGNGDFRLSRAVSARAQFESPSIAEEMDVQDPMLLFHGAVGTLRYLEPSRIHSIKIGHDKLAAAVPRLEERAIRRIDRNSAALRLLDQYTAILRKEGPTGDPLLDHHVAQHIIDLVALAMGGSEETRERAAGGAVRAARLAAVRADVLANLSEMRLSAKTVAKRHGLSDRYVHVLFEQTGKTFAQFVEEERLKRARALLMNPARAEMRISEIAAEVGYIEHSTFTRAFRRRFGETPRGVRRDGVD
jgi:AraC-like DNA-binding protein